jgi:hypothetical protein
LTIGRLILTAHSGGGAPLAAVLSDADPDEVHIFDGTYGTGGAIAGWARRRIAREVAAPSGSPPALRILFRPGTQTQAQAKAIWQQVCSALHEHSASHLRGRFRVESTTVGHNDIPSRFGWRLLDRYCQRARTVHTGGRRDHPRNPMGRLRRFLY